MKQFLRFSTVVLPLFAALAIEYAVIFFCTLLYNFLYGLIVSMNGYRIDMAEAMKDGMPQNLQYFVSVVAALVCGVIFLFWYREETRGEAKKSARNVFRVKNIILFVILGFSCQILFSGVMSLVQPYFTDVFSDYTNTVDNLMSGNNVIVLLYVVLVAPAAEELIFRGVILHKTSRWLPFLGANLMQALLFGVYHWNVVQGVYATLLGFLLGLVYRKYKTIFATIFLHMLINASSFSIMVIPANKYSFIIETAGGIILAGVAIWKLKLIKLTTSNPYGKQE